jgi:hypothetical protein
MAMLIVQKVRRRSRRRRTIERAKKQEWSKGKGAFGLIVCFNERMRWIQRSSEEEEEEEQSRFALRFKKEKDITISLKCIKVFLEFCFFVCKEKELRPKCFSEL